jgi:hypothetical protein
MFSPPGNFIVVVLAGVDVDSNYAKAAS